MYRKISWCINIIQIFRGDFELLPIVHQKNEITLLNHTNIETKLIFRGIHL